MIEVSVLGCGNRLVGDDAVGLQVTDELERILLDGGAESWVPGARVEAIGVGAPGLGLIDYLLGRRFAIIVDAIVGGGTPGGLHWFDRANLPAREVMPFSLHGVGLLDALALGEELFADEMPVDLAILGIEIGSAPESLNEGLTSAVQAAVEPACREIMGRIRRWVEESEHA